MNKEKILHILSLTTKYVSVVIGLASYNNYIPAKWQGVALIAFAAASILKDTVNRIGDLVDDGKENGSFK